MIFLDIETRSACDLKAEGGRRYAEHPSTELLTVAWVHGDDEAVWFPELETPIPEGLLSSMLPGVKVHYGPTDPTPPGTLVAHNAFGFDSLVWSKLIGQRDWIDTEPLARAIGMPGGIDKIGERLRGQGKDKEGKSKLLKFSKADSRYPTLGDLARIAKYNLEDVRILKLLWDYIQERPRMTETEAEVLRVHRTINDRGIRIDVPLCHRLMEQSELAVRETVDKIAELTDGRLKTLEDLRSRDKVFAWVQAQQCRIGTSLRKDALETLFRENDDSADTEDDGEEVRLTPLVREVLSRRFSALRISGAKVSAALQALHHGRLHDILVYFGAHTGRWAGRRVQPQNLPRPKMDSWALLESQEQWNTETRADAVSSLVRGIFIPDDGYFFAAADYNAIELRGLGWLAKEDRILDYFRTGRCPYSAMAKKLYGREVTGKKDPIRQVGKVVVLGCGYQLGHAKMGTYALAQGIDLESAGVTPMQCVEAFRSEFPGVAGVMNDRGFREGGIWNELQYQAMRAMKHGRFGMFHYDGYDLMMLLPSGRRIHYCRAAVENVVTIFGTEKPAVTYSAPRGFRNTLYGGILTENCVQAICRDLLAEALVRIEAAGIQVVLHIHDEIVAQVKTESEARKFSELMAYVPKWADGFPVSVECDTMPRYSKTSPKGWASWAV